MGRMLEFATAAQEAPSVSPQPSALRLADHVVGALIDEVTLTPKPGLVDFRGRGAHRDLSWPLMCHSARSLHPSFVAMAAAGAAGLDALRLRERIGAIGREGEARMMRATAGVNTHRGAIWALGLLVTAAAAMPGERRAERIAAAAGALATLPDRFGHGVTGHKGERACREHGVGGARGQACAGFPHVTRAALPALRAARARGEGEDAARLNALFAVMASLDDTCVLARGGAAALATVQRGAAEILAAGGAAAKAGRRALHALEKRMLALEVSPGGAADLLAATLFLDRIETQPIG